MQQITNFKDIVFPLVFHALAENAEGHWNSTVHGLTYNVQKLLMEIDSELYDAEAAKFAEKKAQEEAAALLHTQRWEAVGLMAAT